MEGQLGGRSGIGRLERIRVHVGWERAESFGFVYFINGLGKADMAPLQCGLQVYHITNHNEGAYC
jgi:hypothetical protein